VGRVFETTIKELNVIWAAASKPQAWGMYNCRSHPQASLEAATHPEKGEI
jgi:hypothetical protein